MVVSRNKIEEEREGKYFTSLNNIPLLTCPKLCASSPEKMSMLSHLWSTYRDLSNAHFPLLNLKKLGKNPFLTEIQGISIRPQIHSLSRSFTEHAAVFNLCSSCSLTMLYQAEKIFFIFDQQMTSPQQKFIQFIHKACENPLFHLR